MSRLTVGSTARSDLRSIYADGLKIFGLASADSYFDGLLDVLDLLAEFPGLGRLRTELPEPARIYPYRSHVIVYDMHDGGEVRIIRIRHGREDWISEPSAGTSSGDEP